MIEFDDAGCGSPLLGEVFVARRVETDEFYVVSIPRNASRKNAVLNACNELLGKIKPQTGETITLCQGEVFNGFAHSLRSKKSLVNVERGKIVGKTNDLAEKAFKNELLSVGVPPSCLVFDRDYGAQREALLCWYYMFYTGKEPLHKLSVDIQQSSKKGIINTVYCYPSLVKQLLF
jgi:hypothetical protein